MTPFERPAPLQSTYLEPEALAPSTAYRGTTLLGGARDRGQLALRPETLGLLCFATDVVMLAGAAAIELISPTVVNRGEYFAWSACVALLTLALFALRGAYGSRMRLRLMDNLGDAVAITAVATMAVISARLLLGAGEISQTAHYWLFATALVAVGRTGVLATEARARRRLDAGRPTLIVGAGTVGRLTARRLVEHPDLGLRPIGFLDKDPVDPSDDDVTLPVLGASWDLEQVVAEHDVRQVVVAFSTAPHHVLLGVVRRCRELRIPVAVVPRLFEVEGSRVSTERIGALPLITTHSSDPTGWGFRGKYAVERVLAGIALLLTLPLWGPAMIAIWLTMEGPVFFRQLRIGSDGREFYMLKLRTMKGNPEHDGEADIDWAIEQLTSNGSEAAPLETRRNGAGAVETDRRTMVGRMLRRFSLDELPQLWNVVRGDMAIVGPRPERVSYARTFEQSIYRYGERHRVKSGITGWAQVNGLRGRTSLSDRVEWDNYYIENWSPWLDLKIVLMTAACIARGQNEQER